ncbi:MAG TPA: TonB family protein [Gemmatimonadaceae bacterium]|nr:TonB family protein [Gemmatimonadaceae bacterium]
MACITVARATHLSAQTHLRVVDSVGVDRGSVVVSTDGAGEVIIAAATSTGRFTVRVDRRMAAAWADSAAAATGPVVSSTDLRYNGARVTQVDPLINATRIMELFRLTTDSASPYALTANNGAWSGDLTLSDSAARHLFAVLRGPPWPVARRARDSVQSGSRDLVFFGFQVERQARQDRPANPEYPETLRRERVQGAVLMEFVVDTMGRAEPGSLAILKSTNRLFALAVREAILGASFHPATIANHPVKQLVQQPFVFLIGQ